MVQLVATVGQEWVYRNGGGGAKDGSRAKEAKFYRMQKGGWNPPYTLAAARWSTHAVGPDTVSFADSGTQHPSHHRVPQVRRRTWATRKGRATRHPSALPPVAVWQQV